MLISYRLNNFKSFPDDATLHLTAHGPDKTYASALINRPDGPDGEAHLLAAAAIYGANASGKTNYLLAIKFMRDAIVNSQASWKPNTGTNVSPNLSKKDSPTEMECVLLLNGVRFRYGFSLNSDRFIKEWLFSYPVGRERLLFERSVEDHDEGQPSIANFGKHLTGERRDHNSSLRRVRGNSLLLSALSQDNQEEAKIVYDFFYNSNTVFKSNIFNRDATITSNFAARYEFFNSMLKSLLETADSSIAGIELVSKDGEVVSSFDSKKFDVDAIFTPIFHIKLGGQKMSMPFENQSQGVKRLYEISLDVIMALTIGKLLIFDEIESSLHPHMVAKMIAMFQNPSINKNGAQILFSTHDTHLLNSQHLRRDQIWFVEKSDGFSQLYSLLEYSPRKDENLELGYLRGRYGAVPSGGISLSLFNGNSADEEELASAERGME